MRQSLHRNWGAREACSGSASAGAGDVLNGEIGANATDHALFTVEVEEILIGLDEQGGGGVGGSPGFENASGCDASDAVRLRFGDVEIACGIFGEAGGLVKNCVARDGKQGFDTVGCVAGKDDLRDEIEEKRVHHLGGMWRRGGMFTGEL